jgi:hypothetical protein
MGDGSSGDQGSESLTMASYIMDDEDRMFVEALRAGLSDDEAEYGWVDELPQDLGIPSEDDDVWRRCAGWRQVAKNGPSG